LETLSKIWVKVTFEDPEALQDMLDLQLIQKYNNLNDPNGSSNLSFNILQQGLNATYGADLTLTSVTGVYTGYFLTQQSDGVCNKDGLAVLVVNIPDLNTKVFTPDFVVDAIDLYNINKPALGDFYGAYTLIPQQKPEDIKHRDKEQVDAKTITLDEFRLKYNRELFCSHLSSSCVNDSEPQSDGYIHDTQEQSAPSTIFDVPDEPISN